MRRRPRDCVKPRKAPEGWMQNRAGERGWFPSPTLPTIRDRGRLYPSPALSAGPFTGRGVPELADPCDGIRFQRRGIGGRRPKTEKRRRPLA